MYDKINISTSYMSFHDVTEQIKEIVKNSGIKNGTVVVFNPHTTAAMITTDTAVTCHEDIQDELDRLFPLRANYNHVETPFDAAGHVKAAVVGIDINLIVKDGEVVLGDNQGVYFFEFDGPRPRQVWVKVFGK